MTIRIVVAEDQPAVRAGLALILRAAPDLEVVGEAADGEQAVALARDLRPDVLLMDVRMPRLDGVCATAAVVAEQLARVLVLTTFDLDEYVFGALRAGAAGFLLKNVEAGQLVAAVRTVAAGGQVIAPDVAWRLAVDAAVAADRSPRADRLGTADAAQALAALTPREREVLGCLGEGLSNAEIADRLGLAEATVKTHVSRLLGKLELRSRAQAAVLVRDLGG